MLNKFLRLFSVLGCAVAVVLCVWQVWSYWHREWVHEPVTMSYATSESGRLVIVLYGIPRSPPTVATRVIDVPSEYVTQELERLVDPSWNTRGHRWSSARVGWGWRSLSSSNGSRQLVLIAPHVLFAIVLAAASIAAWRFASLRERRRRISENRCLRCDYDLRGINAGRCPECGEAFAPPATGQPAA